MMMSTGVNFDNASNRFLQQQMLAYNQQNMVNANDSGHGILTSNAFEKYEIKSGDNWYRRPMTWIRRGFGTRSQAEHANAYQDAKQDRERFRSAARSYLSGSSGSVAELQELGFDINELSGQGYTQAQIEGELKHVLEQLDQFDLESESEYRRKALANNLHQLQGQYVDTIAREYNPLIQQAKDAGYVDTQALYNHSTLNDYKEQKLGNGDVQQMLDDRFQAIIDSDEFSPDVKDRIRAAQNSVITEYERYAGTDRDRAYKAAVTKLQQEINRAIKETNQERGIGDYRIVQEAYKDDQTRNPITAMLMVMNDMTNQQIYASAEEVQDNLTQNMAYGGATTALYNSGDGPQAGQVYRLASGGQQFGSNEEIEFVKGVGTVIRTGENGEELLSIIGDNQVVVLGHNGKAYLRTTSRDENGVRQTVVTELKGNADDYKNVESVSDSNKTGVPVIYMQRQSDDGKQKGELFRVQQDMNAQEQERLDALKKARELAAESELEDSKQDVITVESSAEPESTAEASAADEPAPRPASAEGQPVDGTNTRQRHPFNKQEKAAEANQPETSVSEPEESEETEPTVDVQDMRQEALARGRNRPGR